MNERLSQTLSRINVLEAQVGFLLVVSFETINYRYHFINLNQIYASDFMS